MSTEGDDRLEMVERRVGSVLDPVSGQGTGMVRQSLVVLYAFASVIAVFLPVASGAQTPRSPESERTRAARVLLDDGVDGLAAVLGEAGAPSLTFDQEAQIRVLHETYDRQRIRLLEEGQDDPSSIEAELAQQLLLEVAKFLNPVQRSALGGFVEAEVNRDLPQDEAELREYLRELTNPTSGGGGFVIDGFSGGRMPNRDEIREIRINDNSFTTEQSFQGRGRTEIITRGGTGEFNGDFTFGFADESLDARNALADFRPPYQTREFDLNLSAPILRNRLTLTASFSSEVDEEGDILRAITPSGLISGAIVRPEVERSLTTRATAQLTEDHALTFSFTYGTEREENEGIGGFGLPEQGARTEGSDFNFQIKETAVLSPRVSNEVRFRMNGGSRESLPLNSGPHIDVRGAFRSGGSTDRESGEETSLEFGDLLLYNRNNVSIKTGFDAGYERDYSESFENFNGSFTFSSIEDFEAGRPIRYSVNQGDPVLEATQFETAVFLQSDFRVTPSFTMGLGARYEVQSNMNDRNNVDPRIGFAYHVGGTTVIRGGSGIFHDRVGLFFRQSVLRFDGERQRTLTIRNPSYPDPFEEGEQTVAVPSSVRILSDDLAAPYSWNSEVSFETALVFGMRVTGAYRFVRGVHLLRGRNLNAPLDVTASTAESCKSGQSDRTCVRPVSDRGDIIQLESTGNSEDHQFTLGFQQRWSFANVRVNYTLRSSYSDVSGFGFGTLADNYDLASEWGPDDQRHEMEASVNMRLPWNVDADAEFDWGGGEPYSLETGRDDNQDSNTNDRPPGVSRNSLTGPSFFEMDLNLSKSFILIPEVGTGVLDDAGGGGYFGRRSGMRMTIKARADNVLNRVNVSRLSGVISSPFFGLPIRVRDGREISLEMRFDF